MPKVPRRLGATALVIGTSALIGAGCGSSAPKISDSGYIDKCVSEFKKKDPTGRLNDAQAKGICECSQKDLVAKGFGDRRTDDKGDDLKKAGTAVFTKCALQVLRNS